MFEQAMAGSRLERRMQYTGGPLPEACVGRGVWTSLSHTPEEVYEAVVVEGMHLW